jgi:hypothetical protein
MYRSSQAVVLGAPNPCPDNMASNNNVVSNINDTPALTTRNNSAVLQTLATFNCQKVHQKQKSDKMGDYLKNILQKENLIESKRGL